MAPSDLASATAVQKRARAPGWYVAELPTDWDYFTPSGGVLMTLAMRAMADELNEPEMHPVSANTLFCSPVSAGLIEVHVEVLRRGRAACQLRAALSSTSQPGPGLEVTATFARRREGPDVYGVDMPDVPAPDDCVDASARAVLAETGRVRPFYENFDLRLAIGEATWRKGWNAGEARTAYWYRYRVPQKDSDGWFDALAIPPIADTMPQALHRKLGPDYPGFYAPSLDLTVHFLEPTKAGWHLVDVRCQRAWGGCATANAEIWDEDGKLIAYSTQTMMVRSRKKGRNR